MMDSQTKPFYNSSDVYQKFLEDRSLADFTNIIEVIDQHVAKGSVLLEFGCGVGTLAHHIHSKGYDVTGVDLSEKFISYANDKFADQQSGLAFVAVDFGPLPFPDAQFDCIFTCAVLEHCYDVDKILFDFHRLLKPGGLLVINTPNMISPFARLDLVLKTIVGKRKRYHLYGTPSFLFKSVFFSFQKVFKKSPQFLYVTPDYNNITEGDEDVTYLSNAFDYITFFKPLQYRFLEVSRGSSRVGRVISRMFPRLAGEVLIVAQKPK